jgi:hypothetical protein
LGVLAAKTQSNLKNAKEYFEEHLCVGDYYTRGQQVAGEWFGLGGERLGLSGKVRADEFIRLCENQNPATGETLTQRLNTLRGSKMVRKLPTAGFFTISPFPAKIRFSGCAGR